MMKWTTIFISIPQIPADSNTRKIKPRSELKQDLRYSDPKAPNG